jgi:anti-sigma regulatory factor (Ser/Thr protein kinase)
VSPECRDDAALVVSELVTNAIVHGRTDVDLDLRIVDSTLLEVRVGDTGPGLPAVATAAVDRVGGLGLRVVDQLSSGWGVESADAGKVVWCRLVLR